MPDTYEVQAPDGSTLEIQSEGPPTAADALRAVRAYGNMQAEAAQKKAEAGASVWGQIAPDLGKAAKAAGGAVLSALNPMTYYRAEQANLAKQQADWEASKGGKLPPSAPAGPPVLDQLKSLSDPETGGRAIGTLALGLAPLAGRGVLKTAPVAGRALTTAGEAMNPEVTGGLAGAGGALLTNDALHGYMVGRGVGKAVPGALVGTGRLLTRMSEQFSPTTEGANVRYTPSNEQSRPLTPEEQVPPASASPAAQPNTLMKANTLQDILEEARQQQDVPTRTTAPADVRPAGEGRAEFGYSSGRPAQTGEQYGQTVGNVPEGAPRTGELDAAKIEAAAADKSAAAADQARRQQAAAALPYDANVPLGPAVHSGETLSPEVLAEVRQMAAEMSNLPYVQSKGEFGGVGQGKYGPETIVKGTGGAPVYNDITGAGGYGSRGDVSREIDRVLDGTGGPNANTRAIIETARERVRSGYRPVVSDQSYKTLTEMRQHEYDLVQKSIQNLENPAAAGAGASAGEAAPDFREGLKRQLMQLGEERGTPIDEAAIDEALKDPGAMLGSVAEKFAIGNDDTSFEFGSSAETPAAGEASPVGVGKSGQIPTTQADELERLRLKHGARDASRMHWSGVSEDTTRATTPAPDTGQLSKRSNLLSTEAHDRIENKVNDMVAAGATDTELAAYADNANTQKATDYIHVLIRSALKKAGRPMFALGAAAAGGASLRKALVDQLGGSGKQDQ